MLTIAPESPHHADVVALLRESDDYSFQRYPAESRHLIDPNVLAQPNVHFLVARDAGRAIGCGALVLTDDAAAELKRMVVTAPARGQGVGRAILSSLEAIAREAGLHVIRLETGIHNDAALRVYRAAGYRDRGPFGPYRHDPLSIFMEKSLVP